jgi:hypothetical protein
MNKEMQKVIEALMLMRPNLRCALPCAVAPLLERQTARIVDLQTHIENFDGEDR